MTNLPSSSDHVTEIAHIRDLATILLDVERRLRSRHRVDGRDGYPTRSLGGGGSSSGHADPVADLIVSRDHGNDRDPILDALRQTLNLTHEARRLLERAESVGKRVLIPTDEPNPSVCQSCEKSGVYNEAIFRAGRCRRCYDWQRAFTDDPRPRIVRAWADGHRLTESLVKAVYGPSGPSQRASR